ncbi:hypothetical protein KC902_04390 [Candidatus Kaiserbacteria bacterium]|nr:hypothetical protein [Candidatus Kaiserbacteria bacterium]USN88927.1 MAG: hypothetical protein H6780_00685 [Candidatus Nomurabacteria bacterium]
MSETIYYTDPKTNLEHLVCPNEWSGLKKEQYRYVQSRLGLLRLSTTYTVLIAILFGVYYGLELSGIFTPLNLFEEDSITSLLIPILVGSLIVLMPELIRARIEKKYKAEFLEHNPRLNELNQLHKQHIS